MCDTRPPHIKKNYNKTELKTKIKWQTLVTQSCSDSGPHERMTRAQTQTKGRLFLFFRNCTLKPPRSFIRHSQQIFVFNFSVFRHYRCFQEGFLKTGEQLRHSSTAPSERRSERRSGTPSAGTVLQSQNISGTFSHNATTSATPSQSKHLHLNTH